MITIPIWLFVLPLAVTGALALALLCALVKAEEIVDRRLAHEMYQPPISRVNDQELADRAEAEGDDG